MAARLQTAYYPGVSANSKCLKKDFPHLNIRDRTRLAPNSHATCAFYRNEIEEEILSLIRPGQVVLDVGGNPIRHHHKRRHNIYSLCPLLEAEDYARQAKRAAHFARVPQPHPYCNHQMEDKCNCFQPRHPRIDVMISIDSIYYLKPDDIIDVMHHHQVTTLFAALHAYPHAEGHSMDGEHRYVRVQPDVVEVTVPGSPKFTNSTCDWIWSSNYHSNGALGLTWSPHRLTSQNYGIMRFTICPHNPAWTGRPQYVPFNATTYGEIDYRRVSLHSLKGEVAPLNFQPVIGYSLLHELGIQTPGRLVAVPKNVISIVKSKLGILPRNRDTLSIALKYTQQALSTIQNLTPAQAQSVEMAITLIAMYEDLPETISLLTAADTLHENNINTYNSLIIQPMSLLDKLKYYTKKYFSSFLNQVVGHPIQTLVVLAFLAYIISNTRAHRSLPASIVDALKKIMPRLTKENRVTVTSNGITTTTTTIITDYNQVIADKTTEFGKSMRSKLQACRQLFQLYTSLSRPHIHSFVDRTLNYVTPASAFHPFYSPLNYISRRITSDPINNLLSPLLEESMRVLHPTTSYVLTAAETAIRCSQTSDPDRFAHAVYVASFHCLMYTLPCSYLEKLLVHVTHNTLTSTAPQFCVPLLVLHSLSTWLRSAVTPASIFHSFSAHELPPPRLKLCFKLDSTPTLHSTAYVTDPDPMTACTAYKPGLYAYGPVIHNIYPIICAGCTCNEYRSITTRQCLPRLSPDPTKISLLHIYARDHHKLFPVEDFKIMTFDQWNKRFPEQHRMLLREAHDSLVLSPIEQRDLTCNSFVKQEKQLDPKFSYDIGLAPPGAHIPIDHDTVVDIDPRNISGRSYRFKTQVGPTIASLELNISKLTKLADPLDPSTLPFTMTKGYNQTKLGIWYDSHLTFYSQPIALTNDGSRWDATMNEDLLQLEMEIYQLYDIPTLVHSAIKKSLYRTSGVTKTGIHFNIHATRKSGDPNTSLGNSIINGFASTFIYNYILSCTPDLPRLSVPLFFFTHPFTTNPTPYYRHKLSCGVDGDDNIALIELQTYNTADKYLQQHHTTFLLYAESLWKDLGINPKMEVHTNPLLADYLSGHFYPTTYGLCHGPKLYRPLVKQGWSIRQYNKQHSQDWLYTNSIALTRDWAHLPILSAFSRYIMRCCPQGRYNIKYMDRESSRRHVTEVSPITLECRELVEQMTDITIQQQIIIEHYLDSLTTPRAIDIPWITSYIQSSMSKRYPANYNI